MRRSFPSSFPNTLNIVPLLITSLAIKLKPFVSVESPRRRLSAHHNRGMYSLAYCDMSCSLTVARQRQTRETGRPHPGCRLRGGKLTMVTHRDKPVVWQGDNNITPPIPIHDKNRMKSRIQNNASCIQRSRKRRDPPVGENSAHPAMSSADFNYLSIPTLFGGQPASSRFESSMHDCMIQSGAYVSYIAEAMDPTPRLDPEGAFGGPKASSPAEEEIDFVDENTVTDKSDDAFIRANMHRIENNETIRKRPPDHVGSLRLINVDRPSVKEALGSIVKEQASRQQIRPLSCTPRSLKTPRVANLSLTSPLKCFGGDPGSPNSTTTGGGNTDAISQGGSLKISDSDSIDGPQQLDCKINDHELPYSPSRRVGRRTQTPRRQRSRAKSKAPQLRQSPRRKMMHTPPINFTSTIESGSLKSYANPSQNDETAEHIEVIFVEEQFRKNDLFQVGRKEDAIFSLSPEQPNPADNPLHRDGTQCYDHNESAMSPSNLKHLRKKSIMDNKGMTTEEESTVRLDERDSNGPGRMTSPIQKRQPASPMVETVDKTQVDETQVDENDSADSAYVSQASQNPLEYSQSETTDQKNLDSQVSVGEKSLLNQSSNGSELQSKGVDVARPTVSDESHLRTDTGEETASKPNPSFPLNTSTDDALGALSGRSFFDASLSTNASILVASSKSQSQGRSINPKLSSDLPNATDDAHFSDKSTSNQTITTNGSLAEVNYSKAFSNAEKRKRFFEMSTPSISNGKSEFLLDLEIARSNEVPESDATKEQVSRDMFTVKSDANKSKGSSQKDPRTSARVDNIMALVDCADPVGDTARETPRRSEPNHRYPTLHSPGNTNHQNLSTVASRQEFPRETNRFPAFFVPFQREDEKIENNMLSSRRLDKSDAFFVPFNPSHENRNKNSMQGQTQRDKPMKSTSPGTQITSDGRGQKMSKLVEKHNALQSIHKETQSMMDTREINSIIAESNDTVDGAMYGVEAGDGRTTNPHALSTTSINEEIFPQEEAQIKPIDLRLAMSESVPSSQPSRQDAHQLSHTVKCSGLASESISKTSRDVSNVETVGFRGDGCTSPPIEQLKPLHSKPEPAKLVRDPLEKTLISDHQSSSGSQVEGYFTCLDKDGSTVRQSSEKSEHKLIAKARPLSNRGRTLSPLTVEKSLAIKDSKSGFDSLSGGPPRMIEIIHEDIIQEDESGDTDKSAHFSMVPLKPNESTQSQFDSVSSAISGHPSGSGWDISSFVRRSYIGDHAPTSMVYNTQETDWSSIPREISTADAFSVSVGTMQSCLTSTTTNYHERDRRRKDHLEGYSRGRTISRTTYIHRTHSSVSVASDRKRNAGQIMSHESDRTVGNRNSDESFSHLRSTINVERSQLSERVSSLIPIPVPVNDGNDAQWERAIKSVIDDSGVLLFQPTINLYGSGRLPHGLEPEGVTTHRVASSSTGPEIINLTEAEEERINKLKAGTAETDTDLSLDGSGGRGESDPKRKTPQPRTKKDPEAITASEYQRQAREIEEERTMDSAAPDAKSEVDVGTRTSPVAGRIELTESREVECPPAEPVQVIDCTSEIYDIPATGQRSGRPSPSRIQEERRRVPVSLGNKNSSSLCQRGRLSKTQLSMFPSKSSATHHSDGGECSGQGSRARHIPPQMSEDSVESVDSRYVHDRAPASGLQDFSNAGNRFLRSCPPCDRDDAMDKMHDLCLKAGRGLGKPFERNDIQHRTSHERKQFPRVPHCLDTKGNYTRSCQPCDRSDAMEKMEDLCLKAGQGMIETFGRSFPKRNMTSFPMRKSVIRDDDDDGMETELRDLEVSEQLLRKELELVHEQAEIRRQRLRRNGRNDTLPPRDIFSECLWPSNTEGQSSNRMLGRGLVAQSFSTSHKSIDDDLTDNYFSPTEDDSTGIYLSPQTSLEQTRPLEPRGKFDQQKSKSDLKTRPDDNEEMEVIFVEESFMSTDSFSFGEVTKKSVCSSSRLEKEIKSENDGFSYLRRAANHSCSSGPDPICEKRSDSQKTQANQQVGGTAEPVEIISVLSIDRLSSKSEEVEQPGDPSMPIQVGSEDVASVESRSSSPETCDPPGTAVGSYHQATTQKPFITQEEKSLRITAEKTCPAPYLRTSPPKYLEVNDSVDIQPLESIEVVVLENSHKSAAVNETSIMTPQTLGSESVDGDSINDKTLNQCNTRIGGSHHAVHSYQVRGDRNSLRSSHNNRSEKHRPTVTFLLPTKGVEGPEGRNSHSSSDASLSTPWGSQNQSSDIIDLRDFDESVLGHNSTSSSSDQFTQQSGSNSSTRVSSSDYSSRVSEVLQTTETSKNGFAITLSSALDKSRRPATGSISLRSLSSDSQRNNLSELASLQSKGSSGGVFRNESSGTNAIPDTKQPRSVEFGPESLETIEKVQDKNHVIPMEERQELPLPNGMHESSYGASTFEEDTCESLSSRVKKLIAKAKANNKRETGHDTFESRSTLTIDIPESLSITEDDEPAPSIQRKKALNDDDFEKAVADNISPEFTVANQIPARVMLARPGSQDQSSLSTVTLPLQFKETHAKQSNGPKKKRTNKGKTAKYPDLMTISDAPSKRDENHVKGGMLIHISEADDDSSVTWDFPETLLPEQMIGEQRSKSPSRIQRLINTGKRFVSTKRKSPQNREGSKVQHQSSADLERALQNTWSIEAQTVSQSHSAGADSVEFTYSISPNESVRQDETKQFKPSGSFFKTTGTPTGQPNEMAGRKLLTKRLERVRKLNRSFFPKQKSHVVPMEESKSAKEKRNVDIFSTVQTSASNSAFEERFEAMRQRVQEIRGLGQSTQGSTHQSSEHSPRPPLPPRRDQGS